MKYLIILFCTLTSSFNMYGEALVIGIAGGTGSGKTTMALKIQEALSEHSVLVSQDFYYKDLSHLSPEEREKVNFDHPNSIDFDAMRGQIAELKEGRTILCPQYDFISHTRKTESLLIEPARVIIVEGILIFAVPELRELFDWKIFIDTDSDVRILRRMERDLIERGRDFDSIKAQYLKTVKPMHEAFVHPSKQYADIIVPKGGENGMALKLLLSNLVKEIKTSE